MNHEEDFGEAMMNHHEMSGRYAGARENAREMWSKTSRSVKMSLLFLGLVGVAALIMVSYNISGRGSTHISSGTGIDVVRNDKEHYTINALIESQTAKVIVDLESDDDSDGLPPIRIIGGHIHGKFGFNNFSTVNSGETSIILENNAKDTDLYDVVALQNTIESYESGDVSYALADTSINVSSVYRYEHSIHWHAVVTMGTRLDRVCGFIGLNSLPNSTNVEFDGIHALQCTDADADGFALLGGSTIVSLEGENTVELRMASNNDLQVRGAVPTEVVHVQVTITVV